MCSVKKIKYIIKSMLLLYFFFNDRTHLLGSCTILKKTYSREFWHCICISIYNLMKMKLVVPE